MEYKSLIRIIIVFVIFMMTLVLAVAGYMLDNHLQTHPEDPWSIGDAIYMVVITVFGVGYGEVHKVDTTLERVVTIILIVVGTGGMLYAFGEFLQMLNRGQIQEVMGVRRMNKHIKKQQDHVIICGYGRVGRILAVELEMQGIDFVIIEQDSQRAEDIMNLKYDVIVGDATSERYLREAGIDKAKALATVLPSDAVNVFITLSARNLNPDLHIIARGERQSTEPKLMQAGANEVVLPAALGAFRISHLITKPTGLEIIDQMAHDTKMTESIGHLGLSIDRLILSADCDLLGTTLSQLQSRGGGDFLIFGLQPTGQAPIPNPDMDHLIEAGDQVIIMGHATKIEEFKNLHQITG